MDPDCHTTKYCEKSNLTCADPCIRDPCGPNAFGTPFNHVCNCQCIEGFTGNPKTGCSKYFIFSQCSVEISGIFLSFIFYVKSILEILENLRLLLFAILGALKLLNLVNFSLQKVQKIVKIQSRRKNVLKLQILYF